MSSISAGTTTTTGYVVTSDTTGAIVLKTGASNTTAVTIDASQRVGVGTASPSSRLEVAGDASPILKITSTSGPYSQIQSNTAGTLQLMADEGNTGASTSIRFRVDAAEVARFDSAGNLGLGVTPSAWTTGSSTRAMQFPGGGTLWGQNFAGSNPSIQVACNTYLDSGGYKYFQTAEAGQYQQNAGNHSFQSAPSGTAGTAVTLTTVLNVNRNTTLALQGAAADIAGTGISFPATQNASSNANTLDDYEEGTWTPTLIVDSGTPAYQYQEGKYTKIGNYVFGGGIIGITNSNTLTGGIKIQLPFTTKATQYGMTAGGGSDGQGFTWPIVGSGGYNIYSITLQAQPNTTTLAFYSVSTAATYPSYTSSGVASAWYFRFNFGFFTAA